MLARFLARLEFFFSLLGQGARDILNNAINAEGSFGSDISRWKETEEHHVFL
jgi:hypothetical protein